MPAFIAPPLESAINVGAVLSLTGSQEESGQMAKEGYLFCQDWINAKGGVTLKGAGHQLNIELVRALHQRLANGTFRETRTAA